MGKASNLKKRRAANTTALTTDRGGSESRGQGFFHAVVNKPIIHLLFIAALGLSAYSNSLHAPFMFDDKGPQISENLMLRDLNNFVLYLKGHQFSDTDQYMFVPRRIVGYLSFALNYRFGGTNVIGYHIVNIFIHVANAFLVYYLLYLTFKTPLMKSLAPGGRPGEISGNPEHTLVPLYAALLFISHPIQTQAVTYIMQRLVSLATFFYLLSLVMYVKGRLSTPEMTARGEETKKSLRLAATTAWYLLSLVSAIFAFFTKEIAYTLPLMTALYEVTFFKHSTQKIITSIVFILCSVAIAAAVVISVSDKSLGNLLSDLSQTTRLETDIPRWDYLMTQLRVIVTYIRLILMPVHQNLDYDYPIYHSLFQWPVFFSFIFLTALLAAAVYLYYKSHIIDSAGSSAHTPAKPSGHPYAYYRLTAFGIIWFFVALSVESSIIPIADVIFEHRVYLPSIGLFAAILSSIFMLTETHGRRLVRYISYGLLCVVIALSIATFRRNAVWQDEETMWEDVASKSPDKARPLNNFASILVTNKHYEAAIGLLTKVVETNPGYFDAYNNLALAYIKLGVNEEAFKHVKSGKFMEAVDACNKALQINPNSPQVYNNLSTAYRKLGRYDDALKAAEQALRIRPGYALAYNNFGLAYIDMKRQNEAELSFKKAVELDPKYTEAYNNLGGLYLITGRYAAAIEAFRSALREDPSYVNALENLGMAYSLNGDHESAMLEYMRLKDISAPEAERLLSHIKM